jgi:hypothetical protein
VTAPLRRATWIPLAIAVGWCLALVVVLATVTMTRSTVVSLDADGTFEQRVVEQTQVERDGWKVIGLVAVPLVPVLVTGAAIARRRGVAGPGPVAGTCTGMLLLLSFLGMLSVGPFVFPVAVCLVVAVASA